MPTVTDRKRYVVPKLQRREKLAKVAQAIQPVVTDGQRPEN